jgi:hypothetical protein
MYSKMRGGWFKNEGKFVQKLGEVCSKMRGSLFKNEGKFVQK